MLVIPTIFPSQECLDAHEAFLVNNDSYGSILAAGEVKVADWSALSDAIANNTLAAVVAWDDGTYSLETMKRCEMRGGFGGPWIDAFDASDVKATQEAEYLANQLPYGSGYPGHHHSLRDRFLVDTSATGASVGGHADTSIVREFDLDNLVVTFTQTIGGGNGGTDKSASGFVVGFRTVAPGCAFMSVMAHTMWYGTTSSIEYWYTSEYAAAESDLTSWPLADGYNPLFHKMAALYNHTRIQIMIDLRLCSIETFFGRVFDRAKSHNADMAGDMDANRAGWLQRCKDAWGSHVATPVAVNCGVAEGGNVVASMHLCKKGAGIHTIFASNRHFPCRLSSFNVVLDDEYTVTGDFGFSQKELRIADYHLFTKPTQGHYSWVSPSDDALVDVRAHFLGALGSESSGGVLSAPSIQWQEPGAMPATTLSDPDRGLTIAQVEAVRDDGAMLEADKITNLTALLAGADKDANDVGLLNGSDSQSVRNFIITMMENDLS